MDKNDDVRNKIVILYILSRIPGITAGELTAMALDTCCMNYFAYASAFESLAAGNLITRMVRKGESEKDSDGKPVMRCDTTAAGLETLGRLSHLIPAQIRSFLDNAFLDWEKSIRKKADVRATSEPDAFGGYAVSLLLSDGTRSLIDLKISVPSKELAVSMCARWKEDTQAQYLAILSLLSASGA